MTLREECARALAHEDGYREPQKHHYREADAAIAIVLERAAKEVEGAPFDSDYPCSAGTCENLAKKIRALSEEGE